ncbi:MAG: DUF547 domain-containing protein [Candidatus Hydrogenedentota bacterium]|jgi:hypothetical protein|nr:DUF547 domain-containing protein [Candidatus Sumerlaea chitinivorans]RMH25563.1 MAG: DUF547 domain-containing protein [Candidatus Hydrogenedentota bacterium]
MKTGRVFVGREGFLWLLLLNAFVGTCYGVPGPLEIPHRPFNEILQSHVEVERHFEGMREVVDSRVRYAALRNSETWKNYLKGLAHVSPSYLSSSFEADRKAFWINAYNAFVLETVVSRYPISGSATNEYPAKSIRAISDWKSLPHGLAGRDVTLEEIERKLAGFHDPRVWFAICPAARGGPLLAQRYYQPTNLEEQLEAAANRFCYDPRRVKLDQDANELRVVDYLREYLDEFAAVPQTYPAELSSYPLPERALVYFLAQRFGSAERRFIYERHPRLVFISTDWSLND